MFNQINNVDALPKAGGNYESIALDFKTKYKRNGPPPGNFDQFEMAKDVAMFANANGGVILVGARESPVSGVLDGYEPLTPEDAKHHADAFNDAIADRCHPKPLVDLAVLDAPSGVNRVVAVNVWPFPGQVVGVGVAAAALTAMATGPSSSLFALGATARSSDRTNFPCSCSPMFGALRSFSTRFSAAGGTRRSRCGSVPLPKDSIWSALMP
ncbi:MAG: ATP-binding protein [Deltaproteobacteria bacterium]|nr:ATP-binding protein [Deltaproteobacteria bacterium]